MMRPCSDRGIFRFLAIATLTALVVTLAVALPGVSADGGGDKNKEAAQGHAAGSTHPGKGRTELPEPGFPSRWTGGQRGRRDRPRPRMPSRVHSPVNSGESVAVTIYLSGNVDEVDDVVTFLEENGGDPRNVGEDYIEAYVPVTLLGPVSQQPGVVPGAGNRPAAAGVWQFHQPGGPGARGGGLAPGRNYRQGSEGGDNRRGL